jgi:Fe-S cluster assembly protein SufD
LAELPTFTRDAVRQLSASLNEPQWMLEFRLAAWEIYAALPVPTPKHEAWRRTDIRRLKLDTLGPSLNGNSTDGPSIPAYMGAQLTEEAAGGVLVEANGIVTQYEVSDALRAQGVIFCDMHTAVRDHGDLVRKHFMTHAVRPDEGKFAALHGAFWRGGVFLYVPRNVVAAAPLHSALWATSGRTFTHTLVVLDTNSEATFMDEYASPAGEGQAFHNGAIELIVGDGASLRYASLQDFGPNVWQFNHECGRVGRDGKLDWITSVMGTRLTKAFQTSELDAPGAWARMSGIFFTNGRQHVDLDTQQNHNAPDTTSDLLYKGALKDHSRTVWQGMIKALPDSQRIDGFQANRNLMLDKTARADSIPAWRFRPMTCDVPTPPPSGSWTRKRFSTS